MVRWIAAATAWAIAPDLGQFGWSFSVGMMNANYYAGATGVTTTVASAPFDAAAYLRAREQAGTYYWETSSDGVAFTPFAEAVIESTTFDPSAATIYFIFAVVNDGMPTTNAGRGALQLVRELAP